MRRFLILTFNEIRSILLNPPTYFAAAFVVLINAIAFTALTLMAEFPVASLAPAATVVLYSSLLLYPFVLRHTFATENANGTIETLLTAPVTRLEVVMAKYLAGMAFVALHLVHVVVYACLLARGGNLDWNAAAAAILALFAAGSVAVAIGLFASSMTATPAAAVAAAGGIIVLMTLAAELDPYSGTTEAILHEASLIPHGKRWIAGLVDTPGLVYFVSATVLFLFYAWLAVSAQEPVRAPNKAARRRLGAVYLLVSAACLLVVLQAAILNIGGYWEAGNALGHNLDRVPRKMLIPLFLAGAAIVWACFALRAARRAQRYPAAAAAEGGTKYATISDTTVMRARRLYFGEDVSRRRRAAVAAVAALAIAVSLNWLAHYPFHTFEGTGTLSFLSHLRERSVDMTRDKANSLAPATIRALDSLQGRLQVYSFLPEKLRVRGVPVAADLRSTLARYSDVNPLVSAIYADPGNESELAAELAGELDLNPADVARTVVVGYQGRHMAIPAELLVAVPGHRRDGHDSEYGDGYGHADGTGRAMFDGENRITQAALQLLDPRSPRIYFTYGHRENTLADIPAAEHSVSRFVRSLSSVNMRVRQHSIAASGDIPEDCDILAILGPSSPFSRADADRVARFLDEGGSLLYMAAPASNPDSNSASILGRGAAAPEGEPLLELLHRLGGAPRADTISDTVHNAGNPGDVAGRLSLDGRTGADVFFHRARSIRDNPLSTQTGGSDGDGGGWTVRRLVHSHETARAVDSEGVETAGPFTLLYRASRETEGGQARAVVSGSAGAVSNALVDGGANLAAALANVQWLAGREETTGVPPRPWMDRALHLSGPRTRAFLWIALIASPLAWAFAGISVWWCRRE